MVKLQPRNFLLKNVKIFSDHLPASVLLLPLINSSHLLPFLWIKKNNALHCCCYWCKVKESVVVFFWYYHFRIANGIYIFIIFCPGHHLDAYINPLGTPPAVSLSAHLPANHLRFFPRPPFDKSLSFRLFPIIIIWKPKNVPSFTSSTACHSIKEISSIFNDFGTNNPVVHILRIRSHLHIWENLLPLTFYYSSSPLRVAAFHSILLDVDRREVQHFF